MTELNDIYDRIYRYCFYKTRNSAAAEDITQEAFLRVLKADSELNAAYLFTVAKNLCTDYFRRRQADELSEDYPCEDFSDNSEIRVAVRDALGRLSEDKREVLVMRYLSELSVGEIASLTGKSRFAVHRLEKAALAEMKKHLKGASG